MQKSAAVKKQEAASNEPTAAAQVVDIRNWIEKLKLPGIDLQSLVDARRKDVDTLLAANEQIYLGLQALSTRQAEIVSKAMRDWHADTQALLGSNAVADQVTRSADRVQQAFGEAAANLREIAEIVGKSHEAVMGTVNKRIYEGLDGVRDQLGKKG